MSEGLPEYPAIWPGWDALSPVLRLANRWEAPSGGGFGPRYVQEFQLLYVRDGQASAQVGDERFEMHAGDLIYYGPHEQHQVTATGGSPLRLFGLVFLFCNQDESLLDGVHSQAEPYAYSQGVPTCPLTPRPPVRVSTSPGGPVRHYCESLVSHFLATPRERPLEARGLLFLLFQAWFDAIREENRQAPLTPRHSQIVREAQQQLLRDLARPPEPEALAESFQMSAGHFARLFKSGTGYTPRDFIEHHRLVNARRLLLEGQLNVNEAARAVGFEDPLYFSRRFTKHFGITPSDLRHRRGI